MTLIIAVGNSEQFIQVSDRRLTANGKVIDDESNKAIIMHCANARLTAGFSGLARAGSFSTREWLLKCLDASGPPDYTAEAIVERARDLATREFSRNPLLYRLPGDSKRLSIMFTGYLYHHDPPLGALGVLTNCFDVDSETVADKAWDVFRTYYREEKRPNTREAMLPFAIGAAPRVNKEVISDLVSFIRNKKPSRAIIEKVVEIFTKASADPVTGSMIGKQLDIIVIPRDPNSEVRSEYRSSSVKSVLYIPDQVYAISKDKHLAISNTRIEPVDPAITPPISGPKLHPNQLCWCQSGKKYKHCHGSKKNRKSQLKFEVLPRKGPNQ